MILCDVAQSTKIVSLFLVTERSSMANKKGLALITPAQSNVLPDETRS
jgi:hypothetical protein